jgi:DnaJ-class molecular chaperone
MINMDIKAVLLKDWSRWWWFEGFGGFSDIFSQFFGGGNVKDKTMRDLNVVMI